MARKKLRNIGEIKRSTNNLVDNAIKVQNGWKNNRRNSLHRSSRGLRIARKSNKKENAAINDKIILIKEKQRKNGVLAYWFPIICILLVILVAIWGFFLRTPRIAKLFATPTPSTASQPQATIKTKKVVNHKVEIKTPTFDIVRIEQGGSIVVAGRWLPGKNLSIIANGKIIATERTDANGEFVYSSAHPLKSGNYTFSLIGADDGVKSEENVFVYISPEGYKNSVSLLMTKNGSTLLQAPTVLKNGDLSVSKIDYLDTGRIVITGDALPRLRVSMSLNDKYLSFAHVSDYRHFGLGADVGKLEPGKEYTLVLRLHDGDGRTIAKVTHKFIMPQMTGDDDTYYAVRRGDCLWIIARNFLRHGVLFSIIAEKNHIANPDLIFPKQLLEIPIDSAK